MQKRSFPNQKISNKYRWAAIDHIFGFSTKESSQKMLLAEGFNSDAGLGRSDDRSSNYNKPYKCPLKTKGEIPPKMNLYLYFF